MKVESVAGLGATTQKITSAEESIPFIFLAHWINSLATFVMFIKLNFYLPHCLFINVLFDYPRTIVHMSYVGVSTVYLNDCALLFILFKTFKQNSHNQKTLV